jgi:hypothetical protein
MERPAQSDRDRARALLWWVIARLWVIVMPVLLALLLASAGASARRLRNRGAPAALAAATVVLGPLVLLGLVIFFLRGRSPAGSARSPTAP